MREDEWAGEDADGGERHSGSATQSPAVEADVVAAPPAALLDRPEVLLINKKLNGSSAGGGKVQEIAAQKVKNLPAVIVR